MNRYSFAFVFLLIAAASADKSDNTTEKTRLSKKDKMFLSMLREVIAEVDGIIMYQRMNISMMRENGISEGMREVNRLIAANSPHSVIQAARENVQSIRSDIVTTRNLMHQLMGQKQCFRRCIWSFYNHLNTKQFQMCERACFDQYEEATSVIGRRVYG